MPDNSPAPPASDYPDRAGASEGKPPAPKSAARLPAPKQILDPAPFDLHDWWGGPESIARNATRRRAALAQALRPSRWFYGDTVTFRVGMYDRLPDTTGKRQMEGGTRLTAGEASPRPRVSIITVVYNNPGTLQRCIDSVRAQTAQGIEHIIIDGGSDTPTLDIIRANAYHIAYFVSEPDGGIYTAMNKGMAVARGDYICLLNSDDTYAPDFVAQTLALADASPPEAIMHTDYFNGEALLRTDQIDDGILIGQMYVCHNTFLAPRQVYDRVGPFDDSFRINGDAVWIRRAHLLGERFIPFKDPLFAFAPGGLSATMFAEIKRLYLRLFPSLTEDEAETVYRFRFDRKLVLLVTAIVERMRNDPLFIAAMRSYVRHCVSMRPNFVITPDDPRRLLPELIRLCDLLDIDLRNLQVTTPTGPISEVFDRLDATIARRKSQAKTTILHVVTVFSAPSETFIYDLVTRLDACDDLDNFVLYETRELSQERPFDKTLGVVWKDNTAVISGLIYRHILQRLRPDLIIAHFAINEFRWAQRTLPLGLELPTICMCHGIDVFKLREGGNYTDHVRALGQRQDVVFTAVSDYLRRELVANGVPADRVHLVHNTVNDRFAAHRRTTGHYRRDRTLQLLAMGRLIDWKGHRYLIQALARFRDICTSDVHLTIVYGNGAQELETLTDLVALLDLASHVTFLPFVDLAQDPGFIARFDLFVHPSTISDQSPYPTESFGVALLEAIASGLPVITTDAGGLPEVVGDTPTPYARIVPQADATALADALADLWQDGTAFADNLAYATDRLTAFSAPAQIARMRAIIDDLARPRLSAALFSTMTTSGAGYAALRVHRGLRQAGVRSQIFTTTDDHYEEPGHVLIEHPSGNYKQWRRLFRMVDSTKTIFTVNDDHIPTAALLKMAEPFDVINLHWHARFLSVENIAALTWSGKPVVMTIRDMFPVTGGCHYFHGCDGWQKDCATCPQIPYDMPGFPAAVLDMKRRLYNFDNLTLVALSRHTRDLLARAPAFRDCRIEIIPNSIETDVFRPYDRIAARKALGLPLDRKIIGYVPSYSSEVKGFRELAAALSQLNAVVPGLDPFVMLVGNAATAAEAITLDKVSLGYISENQDLARAYSAADIIVVPSLEETFSNTAAEAISCGVPVVGFRTGAIGDLAINGKTGYTCEVGDIAGLARGIATTLTGPDMRQACRRHAEETLSFLTQAHRYQDLFTDLVRARQG
jgi:glycosyltransferase involved in cell wall biosynthesis